MNRYQKKRAKLFNSAYKMHGGLLTREESWILWKKAEKEVLINRNKKRKDFNVDKMKFLLKELRGELNG